VNGGNDLLQRRLHDLAGAGITRGQVSPFTETSFELLADHIVDVRSPM